MRADLLPTKIVMDKGIVRYDNMQVNIDQVYPINFKGAINLNKDPGTLDMVAALPYKIDISEGGLSSLKIGEDDKERVVVTVEGTVDKSGIDWGETLKDTGIKAAKDIIKDLLKKGKDDSKKSPEERAIE
jgi:hypothetical protein